jgi:SSS family solute:Na+ symporter
MNMPQGLQTYDYYVFVLYFIVIASYGFWIYKRKQTAQTNTTDFFLAEGQLTWWAIGASLIASNISAEQFIGMSGNGFRLGLAISAYEWLAAVSLVVVGVFFMPVYLKNKIYTMPQFLKTRYNETVAMIMAIFWLFLYIFVNLTSILYLGSIAINNLTGGAHFHLIMIGLAVFALFITLGGMKVIGYTDVIQVLVLTIGGLMTTYIALTVVGEQFGFGKNAIAGLNHLIKLAPDHFKMIFDKPGAGATQKQIDDYSSLPGLAMMAAGMWVANINYWGCNQYITQRALGADLKTARSGIFFAAILKLFMPLLVVIPGIAAYVLFQNGALQEQMQTNGVINQDNAYSSVIGFLPIGLKGLSMAALTAAIVASLAGKANSISTIYSLDIYKKYVNKNASDQKTVRTGRIMIIVSLIIAIVINWQDSLGIGGKGGFEFIQKYTGYISPAIFPVFLLGFFWKKTTSKAAISGIVIGLVLAILFDKFLPSLLGNETILYTALPNGRGGFEIPYLIQMGWVFFFTTLLIIIISWLDVKGQTHANDLQEDNAKYKLTNGHIVMIVFVLGVVAAMYIRFW